MVRPHTRALIIGLSGIALPVLLMLGVGMTVSAGKTGYEVVRDLLVPLVGPLVAVLIPILLFYVIPMSQTRQRLALDLCAQYFSEEMRVARNVGWWHFVTEQRKVNDADRQARLLHFLDYLTNPETHRSVNPEIDAVYQKASRVLDFFAMVDGCLARGVADPDIVRDFLFFYYLWWRDEILDPLRRARQLVDDQPRYRPNWWRPLRNLDALATP